MKKIPLFMLGLAFFATACNSNRPIAMDRWKSDAAADYSITDGVLSLNEGTVLYYDGARSAKGFDNFELTGYAKTPAGGAASIWFHTDASGKGYEVLIHNGVADGSRKTGSLSAVRNLYKSMAVDDEWFPFSIAVRGQNIAVKINGTDVVCYTEPAVPYRTGEHKAQLLGKGNFALAGTSGRVEFKDLVVTPLGAGAKNPCDTIAPVDEQTDPIIRLQQKNFPVVDFHVHAKGWTGEQAQAKSMNYGINYGIAPNCGIGFPITDDAGVATYCDSTSRLPFFFGMQGEGREWVTTFSPESRRRFDYVFTDALTFTDHKGRRTRMWIDDETFVDIPHQEYMDVIVDRILMVLENEPIDIYVNPSMLPNVMRDEYDYMWNQQRIERVVKALKEKGIALEINARYRIPNFRFIRVAKEAGVKFTFGTNNATPEIGKLEYCLEAIEACGITREDLWFPSMRRGL